MTWQRVLPVDEASTTALQRVTIDGRHVSIGFVDGHPRAIADTCPHRGASLSEGLFRNGCVTCPSHLWRFSLLDGAKQGDERTRVPVYPTRITEGFIEVDVPPAAPARSMREILLAHARGEAIDEEGT